MIGKGKTNERKGWSALRHRVRENFLPLLFVLLVTPILHGGSCQDPPGPTGNLVLVIRTFEAPVGTAFHDIDRVVIKYERVEVVHSESPAGGNERIYTVDSEIRTIELRNRDLDVAVGQFEVPVGYVYQVRIRPVEVTLRLKNGTETELAVDNPDLPSWKQSGWKIASEAGHVFRISENEMTGMRGLMNFGDRFVTPQNPSGPGWKIKPTIDAEEFLVNPIPGEPGVYLDQITVVFKPGTSRIQVDEINQEIGASVWLAPSASNAYRIKLPASTNLKNAFEYYSSRPEVQGILPATNYALYQVTPDALQEAHTIANLPEAWNRVFSLIGGVGKRTVRIGVIDTGVNLIHPELYLNIAINQGELPVELFDADGDGDVDGDDIAIYDTDGDGIIGFADLNSDDYHGPLPEDVNGNGLVDAEDILGDFDWSNGDDEDGNGFTDDLVGWNFSEKSKFPTPLFVEKDYAHGTRVSQVAVAVGNNSYGIAGTAWNVSIVPVRVTRFSEVTHSVPDVMFLDAVTYLENLGVDIITVANGFTFASERADTSGAAIKQAAITGIPQEDFEIYLDKGRDAFRGEPWYDSQTGSLASKVLYVFAAGNNTFNLGDPNIVDVPSELMKDVLPDNVLIVGAVASRTSNWEHSSYGSEVDIWAPGVWELLDYKGFNITETKGTSFASPTVAGVAALVLSVLPDLLGKPALLRQRLLQTADPVVEVRVDGTVRESQRPLVNAAAAVGNP